MAVRSDLTVQEQVTAPGPTWIDRQLLAREPLVLCGSFGADVRDAMERRIDYLSFESGGKMTVPFEAFLIFSTNLNPSNLGDEAFLRRIQYKMFLRSPRAPEFLQIFERYAESKNLEFTPDLLRSFVEKHYVKGGKKFRRCHPRDVLNHVIDVINFEALPRTLTEQVLDQAFGSCFVEDIDVND